MVAVISFFVIVPVLSEHITFTQPKNKISSLMFETLYKTLEKYTFQNNLINKKKILMK